MTIIRRIRDTVRANNYELTVHSLDEMDEDNLTEMDVRQALLTGAVRKELAHDPRGIRYVVRGHSKSVEVKVVCRFLPSGVLRIITVYAP